MNPLSGQAGVQTGFDESFKRLAVTDSPGLDPAGEMAGFGSSTCRANRRYRATVSRSIPSSRAIRRCDQPLRLNVPIVCCISILSWCIAAQGHEIDPDCNNYLHLKMAGFDS